MKKLILLIAALLIITLIGQPITLNSKKNIPALSSPKPTVIPTATPTPTIKPVINRPGITPIRNLEDNED